MPTSLIFATGVLRPYHLWWLIFNVFHRPNSSLWQWSAPLSWELRRAVSYSWLKPLVGVRWDRILSLRAMERVTVGMRQGHLGAFLEHRYPHKAAAGESEGINQDTGVPLPLFLPQLLSFYSSISRLLFHPRMWGEASWEKGYQYQTALLPIQSLLEVIQMRPVLISLWILIGSVLGGLFLLALLVFCLWKVSTALVVSMGHDAYDLRAPGIWQGELDLCWPAK